MPLSQTEIWWLTRPIRDINPLHTARPCGCFGHMFRIFVLLNDEMSSNELWCIWLNMSWQNAHVYLYIQTAASISSELIDKCQCALSESPPLFDRWHGVFGLWAFPFFHTISSFHYFDKGWFLFHQSIEHCSKFYKFLMCVFVNFSLAFMFLRFTWYLHLVGNPLSFCSWSLLLFVDKETTTTTITCYTDIKGVFFTMHFIFCSPACLIFSSFSKNNFFRVYPTAHFGKPNAFDISKRQLQCNIYGNLQLCQICATSELSFVH